jgi:GT2 family glycosyltransferase
MFHNIGVVVIGRNEGERLHKCLTSCLLGANHIVYVDSGSSDNSVELASNLGVEVVILDQSKPFSAARARNEGVRRLTQLNLELDYLQFVDGDCEVCTNWLFVANETLENDSRLAVVCGRLKERFPEKSIYNRICDIEWNTSCGYISACGGIFMVRSDIFEEVGGFNSDIIAGEEPELCLRIHRKGKRIIRIADRMALHDANMMHFSQWWKRMIRGGHAYAQGAAMHGRESERYCVKESLSIWLWAIAIPLVIGLLSTYFSIWSLMFLAIYPYKIYRVAKWASHLSERSGDRWLYSCVCVLGKWPEVIGQLKYWGNRVLRKKTSIIEHK